MPNKHGYRFWLNVIAFWFVLLVLALINATIREATYKPLLEPVIGFWAHQISSITGISLFYMGIYWFVRLLQFTYTKYHLLMMGLLWLMMTISFETIMNSQIRHLTFEEILETYKFWKGDLWSFVLLSLVVSPFVADFLLVSQKKHTSKTK